MAAEGCKSLRSFERNLEFLVETVSPEARDGSALKTVVREDADFRKP
jgi:hypothetical protein